MKATALLAPAFVLLTAAFASADEITYDIGPDPIPGFGASFLHTTPNPDPNAYVMSGSLHEILGELTGHWNGSSLSGITGSLVSASGAGNGELAVTGGGLTSGGTGWLQYTVVTSFPGAFGGLPAAGTFYFVSGVGPNSVSADELVLWGQNWEVGIDADFDGDIDPLPYDGQGVPLGFGIDLYGEGSPVPEPGTLALLGVGVAGLVGYSRRRRQARA